MEVPPAFVPQLALLLGLFGASAFFSTTETAFIGVNRIQLRHRAESGDAKAALVDRMLDDPERLLSTVLVGNTIVNISAAGLAAYMAASLQMRFATTIATVLVTVVVLVLCELVPKTLAVQNPLGIARAVARPLRLFEAVLRPVIVAAIATARAVVRPFGLKARGRTPFITTDEIEMLARLGVEGGQVAHFEHKVISEVFEFTETAVDKVMTPRARVDFVRKEARLSEAAALSASQGRTRILVVDGDFDHVLGCVHTRDMLRLTDADLARLPVTHVLRRVLYAANDTPADKLLGRMQSAHCLLAVVQDREGRNLGIVTAEDLLEELVGEIHDEFDAARPEHRDDPGGGTGGGTGNGTGPGTGDGPAPQARTDPGPHA